MIFVVLSRMKGVDAGIKKGNRMSMSKGVRH